MRCTLILTTSPVFITDEKAKFFLIPFVFVFFSATSFLHPICFTPYFPLLSPPIYRRLPLSSS